MLQIGRGEDHFDRQFVDIDFESFDHFLNKANTFDDRVELLENWIARKETEIKSRVNLPTLEMKKPDHKISPGLLKKIQHARENLVANMLVKESDGDLKGKTTYKQLNS